MLKDKTISRLAHHRFSQNTNKRCLTWLYRLLFRAKNKLVHLFFGRIYGATICLRFYLTFSFRQIFSFRQMRLHNGFKPILGQYITWLWATVYVCIIVRLDEREPSETAATQMLLTRPFTNEISPKVEFWSEKLTFVGLLLVTGNKYGWFCWY